MTDTQLTIVIASIPTTLGALGALVMSILTHFKASATNVKTDAIIMKTEQIREVSNGHLSKVTSELQNANTKIQGLQDMVASLLEAKGIADRVAEKVAEKVVEKASPVPTTQITP